MSRPLTNVKLKKIHRILESNESQWLTLKPYIEFNTHKKIEAENNKGNDGKTLYKLMNNAIYRKIGLLLRTYFMDDP